jgi:hypothetical protein
MTIREEIYELLPFTEKISDDNELIKALERIIMMCDEEWLEDNMRLLNGLIAEIRNEKIEKILK